MEQQNPRVLTVNIGAATPTEHSAIPVTGIDKQPVEGPVLVRAPGEKGVAGSGLVGDVVCDLRHHGGDDQAVYAYAREDLDDWQRTVGRPLGNGVFGENLTTTGIDLGTAVVGEQWAVGEELVLEVSDPRIPCRTFAGWLGERGWVRRFTEAATTGTYLRVLHPGEVRAGDPIVVRHRPDHGITVRTAFRALTTQPELLPELIPATALSADARATVARRTGSGTLAR
ncbi:MOSC domain-containing protein [Nakamurella sp. YIM 132087]|uniref:MOSC domain-containing protein n=1 Tax=Nakamurella alba TaxID=2665158 RepID=A0A7K1FHU4_9ACTN|nr:MOSC domain-containing protein [Nakamurella alba]MTD13692.1 MOSC domain-containing protein [Nakamurella alba]